MKPYKNLNGPWKLRGYSDADNTGDNDTCKIFPGDIVLINRVPISWHLQIQKKVTQSVI